MCEVVLPSAVPHLVPHLVPHPWSWIVADETGCRKTLSVERQRENRLMSH
jgi:hypothetical protein